MRIDDRALDSAATAAILERLLARSALRLTELLLGCAQLGNLYRAITDEDATVTVEGAWESGVRCFDTGPH